MLREAKQQIPVELAEMGRSAASGYGGGGRFGRGGGRGRGGGGGGGGYSSNNAPLGRSRF